MPSQEQNYETWNNFYDWSRYQGDEWSARWGGHDMQWYWCLYPRIASHLPARNVLEIGPGFGRWVRYLIDQCDHLYLVDISEKCINACRRRFGEENITYRVGSGNSLEGLEDESIDFAFSWETLTYVEQDDLEIYLASLYSKLTPEGTAFLHHSNLANYARYFQNTLKIPKKWRDTLKKRGLLDYDQWRARTVTAESFKQAAEKIGFQVWSQEWIPWGGKKMIDCLSVIGKKSSEKPYQLLKNPDFHKRAYDIQELSWLYGEGVPW